MFVVVILAMNHRWVVRLRLGQTLPKLEALVADLLGFMIPLDITTNDISALLDED